MESLLGFKPDFWDYATFAVLALLVLSGLISVVWLAGMPGRIAIARKHPDAEAVKMMGYAGFLAAVPWIQAFIWAFKPTDIVDIRRFPSAEAQGIDEETAHRVRFFARRAFGLGLGRGRAVERHLSGFDQALNARARKTVFDNFRPGRSEIGRASGPISASSTSMWIWFKLMPR